MSLTYNSNLGSSGYVGSEPWAPPASTAKRQPHLLLVVNASWNIVNFRAGLIAGLQRAGYRITIAAPRDAYSDRLAALGCRYVELPMQAHGRSPLADLGLLGRLVRLVRAERPDVVLGYTAKPNIYGSIAAAICGVPVINNIAGLGMIFNEKGVTNHILRALYRIALRRSARVFFQNRVDLDMFVGSGIASARSATLLPGSGVDLRRFQPAPRVASGRFVFLLVARLLWQKGIAELVAAARLLRRSHPAAEVRILGFVDGGNDASVQHSDLATWAREGDAQYLGTTDDVRPYLAAADCVVLPSYYPEGTPRSLLEAAASGKPIITCDMPGCRDVVIDGANGFLVTPRDVWALANAMGAMVDLAPMALAEMGTNSRRIAEDKFDEAVVIDRYQEALALVAAVSTPSRLSTFEPALST